MEEPPRQIHGIRWFLVVIAIYSSTFLYALDSTIVANIQPAIVQSLDGLDKIAWLGVAFVMASSGTLLSWLQLFSVFNLKWLYIASIIIFEIGSTICGAAPTMNVLIGGRVVCGIGGVGQYIGVMNFIPRLTTLEERPRYIGLLGITYGGGTVLGPVLGGAFTDSGAGWRWSFYINLCIGGLFSPVYAWLIPSVQPQRVEGTSVLKRLRRLDYLGSALLIIAFVAGVIGLNFGGVQYPWHSGGIIAALVVSGVAFVAFALQQVFCLATTAQTRLFPVEMVSRQHPLLLMLFVCSCSVATCITVPTYMIPLYFQFISSDGALQSAVRLLPFILPLVCSGVGGGFLVSQFPVYKPWYLVGGILSLVGASLLCTVSPETSFAAIYGYSALLGLGAGMYMQLGHSVAQAKTPPAHIAAAITFVTTAQLNGLTFGLAITECVFLNEAIKRLSWVLPNQSHATLVSAISGTQSAFVSTLDSHTKQKALGAIIDAMDQTFVLAAVGGGLVVVLSLCMKWEKLVLTAVAAG
ncbi:hypothetical protein ASPWEDRAFT_113823 [Aspergillus wentii DTO 134E9]|uniref:Major facilitator superfamily (MFS) profile domain-containing protein n=1 Tax=Aspergillus wentii DTO 134E9 TaxID=1073089 RepID=A0A1L9RI47_ASPWE|nr:uncharacterized protein ASPWEDRAFT_113823 [Aspergillus wentii DTO 134E9]OJJ34594.1 hypothetical protein ASPWEDRAFT_113823 [Aspergillus wentii DTO 134E9]